MIGLGYVGLPLATAIAESGFFTVGIDRAAEKVDSVRRGSSHIKDVSSERVERLVREKKFTATTDFSALRDSDFISICVPTPLNKGKNPDLSYIISAVQQVKNHLKRGQVVVLESTTYPGTTEEIVLPLLEETGLKAGKDFYLAFSPERIDPGNRDFNIQNTPKIVGGITKGCTEVAASFYRRFVKQVVPVSSASAAEMTKLLENTFRAINIGLANEVAIMCNRLGIDGWEVIEAAATKPYGFMPFYPGPGLGGHCIPVDPHYLVWKLKTNGYNPRFIQLADEINSSMPHLVVEKISAGLNDHQKSVKGAKILILGVAYKKDIDDYRESPALDVIDLLQKKGADVSYYDPYVPELNVDGIHLKSTSDDFAPERYDCVALLTNHSCLNLREIVCTCSLFVDTRNATKGLPVGSGTLLKL